jgi:hypothetical protein
LIGTPGCTLFNGGIGSIGADGIQSGLLIIPLEPSGSGYGSPVDFLTDRVGMDWFQ